MTKTATVHAQQMWEYQELTRKSAEYLTKELNDIGQQGWELVSVLQALDRKKEVAWIAFVKRPYVPGASPPPAARTASRDVTASEAHANAPAPATQKTGMDEFAIGDDEEFKLEDLEDLVEETAAPAKKIKPPATESDDTKGPA